MTPNPADGLVHDGAPLAGAADHLLAVIDHRRNCDVVALVGEHDISNNESLTVILADAVLSLCDAPLVVDLSRVEFMSAATVHAIERARRHLALRSRPLTLRSPSPIARRLLDVCQVDYELAG